MYGSIEHDMLIRYAVAPYIAYNENFFRDTIYRLTKRSVKEYVKYVQQDGKFGDNVELSAIMHIYNVNIDIYRFNGNYHYK